MTTEGEGGILQRMVEIARGTAWEPHPMDCRHPLRRRMGTEWFTVVLAGACDWRVWVIRWTRRGELETGAKATLSLEMEGMHPVGIPAEIERLGATRLVFVQANGWEVERAPREGEPDMSPYHSVGEEGRLYSKVPTGGQDSWQFSVSERRVVAALEWLERAGYECVRCVLGMASLMAHQQDKTDRGMTAGDILVFEYGGEWLVMRCRGTNDWDCLGQGTDAETADQPGWVERIPDGSGRVTHLGDSGGGPPTHGWMVEAALWDPHGEAPQVDLRGRVPSVRDCLGRGTIWLRPVLVLVLIVSLASLWWQVEESRKLLEPMEYERARLLEEAEKHRDLRERTDRKREWEATAAGLGEWVAPLLPLGMITADLLETVPEGVWIRQFQTRRFSGQRQVEIRIDLEGDRVTGAAWTSTLWELLGGRGYQLVTLDQSERSGGIATRALFLIPYPL